MKRQAVLAGLLLGLAAVFSLTYLLVARASSDQTTSYSALHRHGQLAGYAIETVRADPTGSPERIDRDIRFFIRLLGQNVDVHVDERIDLDTATGRPRRYHLDYTNGNQSSRVDVRFEESQAHLTSDALGEIVLDIDASVYLDGVPRFFRYLYASFSSGEATHDVRVLDTTTGKIVTRAYEHLGEESVDVAGVPKRCLVLGTYDPINRFHSRIWLDEDAVVVKAELPGFVTVLPADETIVGRVDRLDIDDTIFVPTNVVLADYASIDYMRVAARIRIQDPHLSAASLNRPGQRFEGTVSGGMIEGVFEIEHPRYDGTDAPSFPPDFGDDEHLAPFLEPTFMIESEDPAIRAQAKALTADARDAWQAATQISRWVAENIGYSVPGGSAKRTLETRRGECGSHSLLFAALCRSVGIPARMVTGYMMAPNRGGSFGQHGWNEVYMGEKAGWITLDTTAREVDYVDSGHIRLSRGPTFLAESLEILDYRAGALRMGEEPSLETPCEGPWQSGERRDYRFTFRGKSAGTAAFTAERDQHGGWITKGSISMGKGNTYESKWTLDSDYRPVSFEANGVRGGMHFNCEGRFTADAIIMTGKRAGTSLDQELAHTGETVPFEILQPGFYLLVARLLPDTEVPAPFTAFSADATSLIAVSGKAADTGIHAVAGAARVLDINPGTPIRIWLSEDGHLLRLDMRQEGLVVEPAGASY